MGGSLLDNVENHPPSSWDLDVSVWIVVRPQRDSREGSSRQDLVGAVTLLPVVREDVARRPIAHKRGIGIVGRTAFVPGQGGVRSGYNLLEPVSFDIAKVLDHSCRRPTRGQDGAMPRVFIQAFDYRTHGRSLIFECVQKREPLVLAVVNDHLGNYGPGTVPTPLAIRPRPVPGPPCPRDRAPVELRRHSGTLWVLGRAFGPVSCLSPPRPGSLRSLLAAPNALSTVWVRPAPSRPARARIDAALAWGMYSAGSPRTTTDGSRPKGADLWATRRASSPTLLAGENACLVRASTM